jgi:predicted nuclease of predicted toxin-antitoxin system
MSAIWVDAQLSPAIAQWIAGDLCMPAVAVRDLGLRDADDGIIFARAREQTAIILTKDADFALLLERHGPPPRIIWLSCGNTTNAALRAIIGRHADSLRAWMAGSEPLIEIR